MRMASQFRLICLQAHNSNMKNLLDIGASPSNERLALRFSKVSSLRIPWMASNSMPGEMIFILRNWIVFVVSNNHTLSQEQGGGTNFTSFSTTPMDKSIEMSTDEHPPEQTTKPRTRKRQGTSKKDEPSK
ncbi:hypothetical protein LINGRAHAP2_LOCUS4949, partial [Linum grandiflorum]